MELPRDTAGVLVPPPVIFAGALGAAVCAHSVSPLTPAPARRAFRWTAGGLLVGLGFTGSAAVVRAFRKARTAVSPLNPSTRLVVSGPYRYSRNPDYLSQMSMYLGLGILANTWWTLIFLPAVAALVHHGVVIREERYLEAKFGQEYRDYKARVPRWL
jgi:protein-S-isoprenylcysteine O-methyltransferase Ste14